jgi:hypothetical protein
MMNHYLQNLKSKNSIAIIFINFSDDLIGLAFTGVIAEALIVEVSRLGNEEMTDAEKQELAS